MMMMNVAILFLHHEAITPCCYCHITKTQIVVRKSNGGTYYGALAGQKAEFRIQLPTSLKAYLAEPFSNTSQTQIAGTMEELHHLVSTCILLNLIT